MAQLMALGVNTPQINTVGNFEAAQNNAIQQQGALQDQDTKALDEMGALALGVLGGDPNGQVDPQRASQAIGLLGDHNPLTPYVTKNPDAWKQIAHMVLAHQSSTAGEETWYGTPQAFKGTDGTMHVGVYSNHGNFKEMTMPDGAAPAFPVQQLDTGTAFVPKDKFGNNVASAAPTPIDNEGKARDAALGAASGAATAAAPKAIEAADQTITAIDGILNDPALPQAVGLGGILPAIPNTDQAGVIAKIDQLKGQIFLEAYNTLRGGGQITEVEGQKATDAMARLSRAQNLDDFKAALTDLKKVLSDAKARAEKQAAGSGSTVDKSAAPGANTGTGTDPAKMSDDDLKKALGL